MPHRDTNASHEDAQVCQALFVGNAHDVCKTVELDMQELNSNNDSQQEDEVVPPVWTKVDTAEDGMANKSTDDPSRGESTAVHIDGRLYPRDESTAVRTVGRLYPHSFCWDESTAVLVVGRLYPFVFRVFS